MGKNFTRSISGVLDDGKRYWQISKHSDNRSWVLKEVIEPKYDVDPSIFEALDREAAFDHAYVVMGIVPELIVM